MLILLFCSSSPPEFVPSKQVRLLVLPKVESSINVLQVRGEAEAGQPLRIASLQCICFVHPHLISCVDTADNSSNNACFKSVSVCLSSRRNNDSALQVTSSVVDLYNADKYSVCFFFSPIVKFKGMCHKPLLSQMETPKYLKSAVVGTAASSNVSACWKVKPFTLVTEVKMWLAPEPQAAA